MKDQKYYKKQTDVKLTYKSRLVYKSVGNEFSNIPDDLKDFLHKPDSSMQEIVDHLYPDQDFIIEISIRSALVNER